jgi:hypothetical protein
LSNKSTALKLLSEKRRSLGASGCKKARGRELAGQREAGGHQSDQHVSVGNLGLLQHLGEENQSLAVKDALNIHVELSLEVIFNILDLSSTPLPTR